ncbi:nucleotidyltransferase domain-containing protein, partial [Escherichia coli]|nr:nucleotidyltransferase domain-containing protein [Escherichia coli]
MREAVTIEISNQLSEVLSVIERHLESTLLAVHLYGSAVDGGLKPYSDIDLLVTVAVKLDETTRRALLNDLMEGTVAKLAMRQPFVLFKGLTFQKLCLPGA